MFSVKHFLTMFLISENAVSGDSTCLSLVYATTLTDGFAFTESAQTPGGIRLGTSALTSRNMKEEEHKKVASFLHRAVQLSLALQKEAGSKLLKDFLRVAEKSEEVQTLRKEVHAFARQWPLPGVDTEKITRPAGIPEDD